jgi:glycosyltransferase involved in cell wall biosynthesis
VWGEWAVSGATHVYYAADGELTFAFYRKILRDIAPDFIYLNSLFDRDFSIKPFLIFGRGRSVPIILAPRGELSPGALGLKAFRKLIFIILAKVFKFYKCVSWHASSVSEQEQILSVLDPDRLQVFLASNLSDASKQALAQKIIKKPGVLRIVLAARISPMKNTLAAIRMSAQLKGEVELDLWGPLENTEYWSACQQQVQLCPPNVKVHYRGEAEHEKLHALLQGYDLMLLPTLGENFGHSIIEALSAGLPVIISNRTPWKNLMAEGVGADLPLEDELEFVHQLEYFQSMGERDMENVRSACQHYAAAWQGKHANPGEYRKMFDTVITSRAKTCK